MIDKEITELKNLVDGCSDEEERKRPKKRLNEKVLRFNIMMEKRQRSMR